MKVTRVTIRASADPLTEAIRLAKSLVGPADGYASFDVKFIGYLDELGRFTLTPTADAHFSYTFWRSARHGHYGLAAAPEVRQPTLWGAA